MFRPNILASAALAAGLALAAGVAQAGTFNLTFSGVVGDGSYSSQDIGGSHYDQYVLTLTGLGDLMDPLVLQQGDEITATINLDQAFTIPASVDFTTVLFVLGGGDGAGGPFPAGDVTTHGSTDFYLGGSPVKSNTSSAGTMSQIAHVAFFPAPDNGELTFDSFVANFTIDSLSAPVTASYALFSFTRADLGDPTPPGGVPEPATWGLMLAGFFGMGGAFRARRRGSAVA